MDSWEKIVPSFKYDKEISFFEMLVPTVDTVRYAEYDHNSCLLTKRIIICYIILVIIMGFPT